jgi:cell division protein ZapE
MEDMRLTQIYSDALHNCSLQADPAQELILLELENLRLELYQPRKRGWFRKPATTPKGIYLWGGVGRGKSMLMDMFARSMGTSVRRVHFHAFMQDVHSGIARARSQGIADAIQPVAREMAGGISCLAFDEMQITDITDAMLVGRLFEALFNAGITIVATSNRHPNDLYKNGLNRQLFLPFIALLQQKMVVHELASPTDYRQNRMVGRQSYFTPLGDAARVGMDQIWLELAGGPGQLFALEVKSRQIIIPAFRNGIARISFLELCGQPLGAGDYLALAQEAKVLVLDDIPLLGRDNFSEAKRFVTLIDAVYEAGIGLIASAAAKPDELYPSGTGSFEFERTASRLREMQAEDWGQR